MAERKHMCTVEGCGKVFSKPSRLLVHERTHTGERPYLCRAIGCDKAYTRAAHLKRHEETAHLSHSEDDAPSVKCSVQSCGQLFSSTDSLKKHIRRYHERQQILYKCSYEGCGKSFRKHKQLTAHIYSHQGLQPYQCGHKGCHKTFSQKSHLDRHAKMHRGYLCEKEDCGSKFDKWSQLRKHIALEHMSNLPCLVCGKVFSKKARLAAHMKTHSSERLMFACPRQGCTRTYSEKRNLTSHIQRAHEGQRFPCPQSSCGKVLATRQKLLHHLKLHNSAGPPVKKKNPNKAVRKSDWAARLAGCVEKTTTGVFQKAYIGNQNVVDMVTGSVSNQDMDLVNGYVNPGSVSNQDMVDMAVSSTSNPHTFSGSGKNPSSVSNQHMVDMVTGSVSKQNTMEIVTGSVGNPDGTDVCTTCTSGHNVSTVTSTEGDPNILKTGSTSTQPRECVTTTVTHTQTNTEVDCSSLRIDTKYCVCTPDLHNLGQQNKVCIGMSDSCVDSRCLFVDCDTGKDSGRNGVGASEAKNTHVNSCESNSEEMDQCRGLAAKWGHLKHHRQHHCIGHHSPVTL